MRISSDELDYLLICADVFGFKPTRAEWREFDDSERFRVGLPEHTIGWWAAFRVMREITADEARQLRDALSKAKEWFTDPETNSPDWIDRKRWWPWDDVFSWARTKQGLATLNAVIGFLAAEKPFRVKLREGPAWPNLEHLDSPAP